jgi:hypothetical protein
MNDLFDTMRSRLIPLDADHATKPQPLDFPVDLRFATRHGNLRACLDAQTPARTKVPIKEQSGLRMNIKATDLVWTARESHPHIDLTVFAKKRVRRNLPHQMGPDVVAADAAAVQNCAKLAEYRVPGAPDVLSDRAAQRRKKVRKVLSISLPVPGGRTEPAIFLRVVVLPIRVNLHATAELPRSRPAATGARTLGRALRQICSHLCLSSDFAWADLLPDSWQSPFVLVEPVGFEPTLGFLPLIKSQVSASDSSTAPPWWTW